MKRTTAPYHVGNMFSDGNPDLNIEATYVEETWLNAVTEELCHLVEAAGLQTSQDNTDLFQVKKAVEILVDRGGAQVKTVILNNTGSQDIAGLDFKSDEIQSFVATVEIRRRTDDASFREIGTIVGYFDFDLNTWKLGPVSFLMGDGNDGLDFSIFEYVDTLVNKVKIRVSADNMAGANYIGELTVMKKNTSLRAGA